MKASSSEKWIVMMVLALAIVLPAWLYPVLLAQLACMALFACSLNLLFGYAGLLSFGHAAFFGIAAYATGYMMKEWSLTPEIALIASVLLVMGVAFLSGSLAIRRKGIYFSMITLALSQLVYFILVAAPFSNNEDGYQGVPRGAFLGVVDLADNHVLYYYVLAVVVLVWWGVYRVIESPYGEVLRAIKDNEQRVVSLGYNVNRYKVLAFTLSAGVAAVAGSLKTVIFGLASLPDVSWHLSTDGVIMMILGGIGSIIGSVFGATIMVLVQHALAGELDALVPVIMGVIFVVCVLAFRGGVVLQLQTLVQRLARRFA